MRLRILAFLSVLAFFGVFALVAGCECDDDDDDNDNNDDNNNDTDDDDDDSTPACDGYDLSIEGVTETAEGDAFWTAWLNIDVDTGVITGQIVPEDEELEPYDVTGFRHDEQTGELEGSFPKPEGIPDALCAAETVSNHVDFTVIEGAMDGDVSYFCGPIEDDDLLFVYTATGEVACGDFAM
jgi:hypothetical protein